MYSRSQFPTPDEPYRIPENYRGNAFHGGSQTPDLPAELPPVPIPPPTPSNEEPTVTESSADGASDENTLPDPEKEKETAQHASARPKRPSPLASLLPPKPSGFHGGILGDIGAEELLIIGIILLLSQDDTDDDILLLLLLLLFYK